MEKENKENQEYNPEDKLPRGKASARDLKRTPQEPGAEAQGKASFQQGGKQPGNSQGGQGGKTTDGDKNSRHDADDELSIFGRLDS